MKRWIGRKAAIELAQHIAQTYQLHPLVARIVAARGYDVVSTQAFLSPSRAQLHDPFLMHDMDKAVARIQEAIARKETVMIFGDYDVDGVSSVTILVKALRKLGVDPLWRVPDRFCEGYGIRPQAVIDAKEQGVRLIITVDNGIAALETADLARTSGIDLIVTDHHHIGHQLPDAYALVHPALGDYPFPELCGAGVAFKLAKALLGFFPEELMEVVALATIADQVPLIGENRIFVKEGLRQINRSPSVGIHALADVANSKQGVTSTHVAFQLAPRIHAIGRLAHAKRAVELLLADDPQEAQRLALEANALNQKRQVIQEHIYISALAQIEEHAWTDQTLVVAGESWHEGVIGIVAGKLTQNLYKATLCLSIKDGVAKGSGRSVPGVDLYALLQAFAYSTFSKGWAKILLYFLHNYTANAHATRTKFFYRDSCHLTIVFRKENLSSSGRQLVLNNSTLKQADQIRLLRPIIVTVYFTKRYDRSDVALLLVYICVFLFQFVQ